MPAITKQIILGDDGLRRQGFMFLRMRSEFVVARHSGDYTHQLKASRIMVRARANMLTELSRVLGRNHSPADQKLGIPMEIACWFSNLFAATNRLWGAMILMAVTVTTISLGVYLVLNSMDRVENTAIFLAGKATTASGDVLEAVSLAVLDFIVKSRSVTAIPSLTLAAVLRCFGVRERFSEILADGATVEIMGEGLMSLALAVAVDRGALEGGP
ncbi:hypothetical protein Q9L58_004458 [Maublancomyces gigas]|uniref:DUF21 domain-containing protein n=1 Tax=Discina gigas TaxID=1032678 RepID=A0ABR3GLF2_9PEZI